MVEIQNYTLHTFTQRLQPLLDQFAYGVLFERSGQSEARLGEWPPGKGALPSDDAGECCRQLWLWLNAALADATLESGGSGTYRLLCYGPKGVDVLTRVTLKAEYIPDDPESDFNIPEDLDNSPGDSPQRLPVPADRLERAVDLHERGAKMLLDALDRMVRQYAAINNQVLKTLKGQSEAFNENSAQQFANQRHLHQMLHDVIEVLVAERLTASEQQAEGILESAQARGKPKAGKEPNPLALEALRELSGGVKTWLLGGADLPGAAKALLEHPKAKELLTNPQLAAQLQKRPELIDQLMDFISSSIELEPEPRPSAGNKPSSTHDYELPED